MDRSTEGLQAAGEWHELRKLLPDFAGKRVLDLGCGFGWHCRYAVEHGAKQVVGVDISEKMLQVAHEKNASPLIHYLREPIEDIDYPESSFDVVISSLAFHYIASFAEVCERVHRCLVPGGDFVFSVEHPIFTAEGSQQWTTGPTGERLHWPVDRYFDEGLRMAVFLGEPVQKYHRSLTTYVNTLLDSGFELLRLVEPQPSQELMDRPGMKDDLRRPMMLLIACRKKTDKSS